MLHGVDKVARFVLHAALILSVAVSLAFAICYFSE
jgi:hypothetical protein